MATNEPNKQDKKERAPDKPLQADGKATPITFGIGAVDQIITNGKITYEKDASKNTAEPKKETAPPTPDKKAPEQKAASKDGTAKTDKADKPQGLTDKAAPAAESQQKKHGDKPHKAEKPEKAAATPPEKESNSKKEQEQSQKSRAPKSPEYEKALADYNKANAQYKKDMNKWANQLPGENIKQPDPPVRPTPPKAPKKDAADNKAKSADKAKAAEKEKKPPAPAEPEKPPVPRDATRNGKTEQIVYLNISELHAFKDHPFGVRDDSEMKALVESVKEGGVNQPALVRPREDGGYEIVAGHRRQKASELAGYANMPCIVRNMTDDEAILAMTDDNLRQRSEILPSEKAISLKMQVDAIKHQGAKSTSGHNVQKDAGQLSVDIVGARNNMNGKQVQRYIRLTKLVPDLLKAMDGKKIGFTQAVEMSFIKPENQNLIAVSMDGEQSAPSQSQAKRMRELDGKGLLNGDVIDGILSEQKKEVDKVIISGEELNKYFGKEKTPQQMKEQIIKLLDDWSGKEKAVAAPEKKADR